MSAPKFAIGMLFVVAIVAVWSILDAAPWSAVLLRVVIVAVVLQVGYFLVVLAMVSRQKRPTKQAAGKAVQSDRASKVRESNLSR